VLMDAWQGGACVLCLAMITIACLKMHLHTPYIHVRTRMFCLKVST
jgi:hypothetical protein